MDSLAPTACGSEKPNLVSVYLKNSSLRNS